MNPTLVLAALVVAATVVAVACGAEVRLTLLGSAVTLGLLAGNPAAVAREFLSTFADEKFFVPIGCAMGFAFVLRHTGCDAEMVRLLMVPLRRGRLVLIPGVVLAGFVVNIPVISQASAAVCLGAVVVPLLRGAGFSPAGVGSTLLLGASVGGELLNPGAPELLAITAQVGGDTRDLAPRVLPVLATMLTVSGTSFTLLTAWRERRALRPDAGVPLSARFTPRQLLQAAVPAVPLAVLFLSGPPFDLLPVPPDWLVPPDPAATKPDPRLATRRIGLAMLAGVAAAMLTTPDKAKGCVKAFFEGAGAGYAQVVSLIVVATCFGRGVREVGLATLLGGWLGSSAGRIWPMAALLPAGFSWVCGSGMASTQSLFEFFVAPARLANLDPAEVGAVVAVASAAGRTLSPVAAVVLLCASLSGATPRELLGRVAGPVLLGLGVAAGGKLIGVV